VCGEHRLALVDFPDIHGSVQPVDNELLGVSAAGDASPPAIGCLACGAEWPDLASFRSSVAEAIRRGDSGTAS